MSYKVIDVSRWQGSINWGKVKKDGVWGAIVKAGGSDDGFYTDRYFNANYKGCKEHDIHVGAYYFVGKGCDSRKDGEADAKRFIKILSGKKLDLPVYIDFEAPSGANKSGNTAACIGFCETMEKAGYYCGIYSSDISGFRDRLHKNDLTDYAFWVARYGSKPTYVKKYGIWQYSSAGKVNGISGNVDMNHCYKNYPKTIKAKGFNGYKKSGSKTEKAEKPKKKTNGKKVYYTVKKGDTLSEIAKKYDTTYQRIAKLNDIKDPDIIRVGQKLRVK